MTCVRRVFFLLVLAGSFILSIPSLFAQTLITNVFTGTEPTAVALNPATYKVYVANYDDSTITVIDGLTNHVVTTIPVGSEPSGIVVNPVTNRIYVLNSNDYTVSVINGATNHVIDTITTGDYPWYIAINPATNKIYVTDSTSDGHVTVIDGRNDQTTSIAVRNQPGTLAINPNTNRIYTCNWGENTVSIIDGASQTNIGTILVGHTPNGIALNPITNKIYVTSYTDNTLLVINGDTNNILATIPLSDTPAFVAVNPVTNLAFVATNDYKVAVINGSNQIARTIPLGSGDDANALAINLVTNKIYVPAGNDQLYMIDGNNYGLHSITVGNAPSAVAVDQATNRVYLANYDDNDVSVVGGANAAKLQWISVTPCRLVDTRNTHSPIRGGSSQSYPVPQLGGCNIPTSAAAYSLNVTVVPQTRLGYLSIWPTGEDQPLVSTLNSDGRVKANAAIVPAGYNRSVSVYATDTTDLILDIDGYFASPSASTYQFFTLPPCRVADTRLTPNGPLAGPHLNANQKRDFPVMTSPCFQGIAQPQAYSLNVTVTPHVAHQTLDYLTIWPTGQTQPTVSTLNNPTGTNVANAAIVPAGTNGQISAFTPEDTDLIIDVNGYFASPGTGGLSLYPTAPCRVIDTRTVGAGNPFNGTLTPPANVTGSVCGPPSTAKSYVLNATVVPVGSLGYLTLWPDGSTMPNVSTLNAGDGVVTSNMALVPSTDGKTDAYAYGTTQLILDLSSYFAP